MMKPYPCYRTRGEILDLFSKLGVIYLPRTRVDWEPLFSERLDQTPYYLENIEIFENLRRRYAICIDQGFISPVYIARIDDTLGFGLYADQAIKAGDFIGEYAGVVQISGKYTHCFRDGKGHESDYSWYFLDILDKAPFLEINGRYEGNEMRFVNHGRDPNLNVEHTLHQGQWLLFFTAARDIEKDEELLISYGEAYWEEGYRTLQS